MGKTILTKIQRRVLDILGHAKGFERFYFTGGTALAEYYLRHRLSEDLDFFSEEEIDGVWLAMIAKKIKKAVGTKEVDIQQSFNRNLVYFRFGREVLKTEFTYFPFTQIKKPKTIKGIRLDSLLDIAVNKFFATYQKPSARHFIDLYLILRGGRVRWEELPKLARIKFDTAIDPLQLGSQLMMAADIADLPRMIQKLQEDEWRKYFLVQAKKLKAKVLS